MATKTFRYSALIIKLIAKIFGSKFLVEGLENLPNKPVMFVANHFTRFETFLIPYLIYQHTGRQVRCLADSSLHHGMFGRFLERAGAVSTDNTHRDRIILKDLITAEYDWMIYPEGSMIKSKEIEKRELFINHTPYRTGAVRTGSAVLALKAHLYRQDIIEAHQNNNTEILNGFKKALNIEYNENLKNLDVYIVPLSVSYYPIRPGKNNIEMLARKLVNKIPERAAEELEIEGNLLSSAEINLHFGKSISIAEYVKSARELIYQIPVIKNETKTNFVIKYFKNRLTTDFMAKIYSDLQINLDHIFSAAIQHIAEKEISIDHLKRIIYISALMIKKSGKYRLNQSIVEENLFKILIDEKHAEFDSVFQLAKNIGDIEEMEGGLIRLNKKFLHKDYDFHSIRIKNTLRVIYNEFSLLEIAKNIVRRVCKMSFDDLRKLTFDDLCKKDQEIYDADYQIYFDKNFSKDKSVGRPFFLNSQIKTSLKIRKIGILICHGYKSSPREVAALASFFNGFGFKVYVVRLRGHGTSPVNIKDVLWQEWNDSLQRGYAILRSICSKVIVVGFSTGGLLSLVAASHKTHGLSAIVSINAALKLKSIRAKMVPGINIWNEMLEKLHIEHGKLEYVDDIPENPDFNYSRNYLKGVEELGKLMDECHESLKKILVPTLIIQAAQDPVVDPISGKMIYENIKSKNKILFEPNFTNHVIINGDRKEEVFAMIKDFLHTLNLV